MQSIATPSTEVAYEYAVVAKTSEYMPVAFDNPFDTHRIFSIILNTDDIDSLSAKDYDSIIAYYAKEKIQTIIGSNSPEKIRLIWANMLFAAERTVNIYAYLSNQADNVIDHELIYAALSRCLEGGIEVNVILCGSTQKKDVVKKRLVELRGGQSNLAIYTYLENEPGKQYVVITDEKSYLERSALADDIARCNFNSPDKANTLNNSFKEIRSKSTLL